MPMRCTTPQSWRISAATATARSAGSSGRSRQGVPAPTPPAIPSFQTYEMIRVSKKPSVPQRKKHDRRERMKRLLIACLLVFVASCAHMTVPAVATGPDNVHCPGGSGHPHESGPIICIDANTLDANPDHQKAHQGSSVHFYMTDSSQ